MKPTRTTATESLRQYRKIRWIFKGILLVGLILIVYVFPMFLSKAETSETIRIPRDATEKNVADSLSKYFGNKYASAVLKSAKLMRTDFSSRHGAYLIPKGTSALKAARKLGHGAQTPVKITINGFRDKDLMLQKISNKLDFPADSLQFWLNNSGYLSKYNLTPENSLALFLDDTYEVYWSASAKSVLDKIGDNYLKFWSDERKQKAADLGRTPAEVTILASITDEESNALDEKGTIGRLYNNRLLKGMKLQSDPTVRFALNDFTIKRVKGDHLKIDSPYNTYKISGLPPGPIRTTGAQTIDAILYSEPNDYLYMCAKEDFSGRHNFAKDFAQHSANAARYRKALDAKGIN